MPSVNPAETVNLVAESTELSNDGDSVVPESLKKDADDCEKLIEAIHNLPSPTKSTASSSAMESDEAPTSLDNDGDSMSNDEGTDSIDDAEVHQIDSSSEDQTEPVKATMEKGEQKTFSGLILFLLLVISMVWSVRDAEKGHEDLVEIDRNIDLDWKENVVTVVDQPDKDYPFWYMIYE